MINKQPPVPDTAELPDGNGGKEMQTNSSDEGGPKMRPEELGIRARGRKELYRYMNGEKLTYKEGVLAKCFECMAGYVDGTQDCQIEGCPLYPNMPYRGK